MPLKISAVMIQSNDVVILQVERDRLGNNDDSDSMCDECEHRIVDICTVGLQPDTCTV